MSQKKEEEKPRPVPNVDLSSAGRGVWLVKVPKYLSEKWKTAKGKCEVGRMKITRSQVPGKGPEVTFSMSDEQMKQEIPSQPVATPREHKFLLTGVGTQNLVVFSQHKDPSSAAEEIADRIAIEGKVIQRAECRPVADRNYLNLKKLQAENCNKPKREVVQISGPVNAYKPRSDHIGNASHNKEMKEKGKRIRHDREEVQNKLFEVFEKHQYYNIQDLVRLTNQPITYLKEILKELCTYNVKAPHRNMWELKPEYRHYKEPK